MKGWLSDLLKSTGTSLWLWPTITVVIAFIVGTILSSTVLGEWASAEVLFFAEANAGRQVLTALVGGLITALSVIFMLTITGLQLVHQQYSPRLLGNFMQDTGTKLTLSVFAGTVAYILAVLRNMPAEDAAEPVPRLAILGGMALFLACVWAVAYFAQHITNSVRVMSAMDRVVRDTHEAVDASRRLATDSKISHDEPARPPEKSTVVASTQVGYLQSVDLDALAAAAEEHGVTIRLRPMIGDQIVPNTPLAWVWERTAQGRHVSNLQEGINRAIRVGRDRSLETDVAYGFRQLIDVAVRAMSPGINDPYTAVQAIDHLTVLLARLAREGVPRFVRYDDDGAVLVAAPSPDLFTYLSLVCDQVRRYGGQEPVVAVRLMKMLRDVSASAPDEVQPRLRAEVERLLEHAEKNAKETDDLEPVRAEAKTALEWIDGNIAAEETTFVRL
jgi:uncharacterized membrane protein